MIFLMGRGHDQLCQPGSRTEDGESALAQNVLHPVLQPTTGPKYSILEQGVELSVVQLLHQLSIILHGNLLHGMGCILQVIRGDISSPVGPLLLLLN